MEALHGPGLVAHYFPHFTEEQLSLLERYVALLIQHNREVNLISRKNEVRVWEEHILHSLGIAKVVSFEKGMKVLDFGTGGGLPGIPLAIAFPEAEFLLLDSIGKKITAVGKMVEMLGLNNVLTVHGRVEDLKGQFDFAVSRAVTALPRIAPWLRDKIRKGKKTSIPNGLLYIKGGDFDDELKEIGRKHELWNMSLWFEDPFFETKKVVWIDLA